MRRLITGLCVSASLHALVLLALAPSSVSTPRFDVRAGRNSVEMVFAAPAPEPSEVPEDHAARESSRSNPDPDPGPSEPNPGTTDAASEEQADDPAEPETASTPDTADPSESNRDSPGPSRAPSAAREAGVKWVRDVSYRRNPPPRYPTKARVYGEEGTVRLLVTIGPDGRPRRVAVHESSGSHRLDRAARKAVRQWEFVPARQDGEPVVSRTLVPVSFELDS